MADGQGTAPRAEWITAEEIRNRQFGRSQIGSRGFAEEEVSAFLSGVADQIGQYERQFGALYAEVQRLRDFYRTDDVDVDLRRGSEALTAAGSIQPWLEQYVTVMAELARDYATLFASGEDRAAENRLDHACVRASMAIRQRLIDQPLTSDIGIRWIAEFAHALTAQTTVVSDELAAGLRAASGR